MTFHQKIDEIVAAARLEVDRLGVTTFSHLADHVYRLQRAWYAAIRGTTEVIEAMAERDLEASCRMSGVTIRCGRVYDGNGNWVERGTVAEAVERYGRVSSDAVTYVGENPNVTFEELVCGDRFKIPGDGETVYTKADRAYDAVVGCRVYSFLPDTEVIRVS